MFIIGLENRKGSVKRRFKSQGVTQVTMRTPHYHLVFEGKSWGDIKQYFYSNAAHVGRYEDTISGKHLETQLFHYLSSTIVLTHRASEGEALVEIECTAAGDNIS